MKIFFGTDPKEEKKKQIDRCSKILNFEGNNFKNTPPSKVYSENFKNTPPPKRKIGLEGGSLVISADNTEGKY